MRFPVRRVAALLISALIMLGPTSPAVAAPVATRMPAGGSATVGVLFASASSDRHSCTASVVGSQRGDLLITAAHCVTGTGAGMIFVPAYHDGLEPYGTWTVTAAYAAPGWVNGQDPEDDVAFLVVAAEIVDGQTVQIEDVTGGNRLASPLPSGERVTVVAYDDDADQSISCSSSVSVTHGYSTFGCQGYVDGSSGSPWLVETSDGWEVTGVIGGLHQGGCQSSVSYSSPFTQAVAATYLRAISGATPSVLPPPGSNGCTTGL